MERKILNKSKAKIEPHKLIIKTSKKEIKNKKIAEIFVLLDLDSNEGKEELIKENASAKNSEEDDKGKKALKNLTNPKHNPIKIQKSNSNDN